jgi:hypothetical protein
MGLCTTEKHTTKTTKAGINNASPKAQMLLQNRVDSTAAACTENLVRLGKLQIHDLSVTAANPAHQVKRKAEASNE